MGFRKEKFGTSKDGREVSRYILENAHGYKVVLSDLGAVILELWMPDRNGKSEDVALGFGSVSEYEANGPSFGAVVGRYANRISDAKFTLNGKTYGLDDNDNGKCLHSGYDRYAHHVYEAEYEHGELGESVSFHRISPDMEQGMPGELSVTVTYTLTEADELMIEYHAVSDADTIINMTNHNYFNFGPGGHKCGDVRQQRMQVFADAYTPIGENLLPTGEIKSVEGTAFDFREMHVIGERIGEEDSADARVVTGYDHNFVLRTQDGTIGKAVVYEDEETGRYMEVFTDFPGVQVYSAATLGAEKGKDGAQYGPFSGICFETQNYPNAVNQEGFPSPILRAGEEYERTAVFRFGVLE